MGHKLRWVLTALILCAAIGVAGLPKGAAVEMDAVMELG